MSKFVNKLDGLLRSIKEGKSPADAAKKAERVTQKLDRVRLRKEREELRDIQKADTDKLSTGKDTGGAVSRLTDALDKLADS